MAICSRAAARSGSSRPQCSVAACHYRATSSTARTFQPVLCTCWPSLPRPGRGSVCASGQRSSA
eukprot:scaffold111807_cov109-Phaeocystis_antarctica.AAC.3